MEKMWTDPEFLQQILDKLLAVPVLFYSLTVIVVLYLVIRGLLKIVDKALNGDKR